MILEGTLQDLQVGIRGGGNLISHRPVFTRDGKNLLVITSNNIQIFSTQSGDCVGQIQIPSSSPTANILLSQTATHQETSKREESLIILAENGELFHVCLSSQKILKKEKVTLPKEWTPIRRWIHIVETTPGRFLFLGHPENAEEVMLYEAWRDPEANYERFRLTKICWRVMPSPRAVSVGCGGELVTAIQAESVFMINLTTRMSNWHKSGSRKFTCVVAHPTEWIVATGDDSGRILLWMNFLEGRSPAKTVFHWHTLPVADLCFSMDGTFLLSGGGESCLVRWDSNNAVDRKILPRMGLPIRHITVSYGNILTAVSQADNCIQLVDVSNKIERTIQNITQCYIPASNEDENAGDTSLGGSAVFQAGLHFDPNSKGLIMNGKPGHLQCYSLREDKHLYSIDVTQVNYITPERTKTIPNAEVTHVSFSTRGTWLATVESLHEKTKLMELRLKFWKFEESKQLYSLNTSINWPHEVGIVQLCVQPLNVGEEMTLIAATSGLDRTFKTWGLVYDQSILGKNEWWNCENIGGYRELPAGPLTFSQDGSIIAVGFGATLTVWNTQTHELCGSLYHSKLKEDIRLAQFSSNPTSHLVICCTQKNLIIWDVITLSLVWTVPLEAESLAVDPLSNLVGVFSAQRHLYFFQPDTPEPLAIHKDVSRSKIASSVFVPNFLSFDGRGRLKSSLVFVNSSQELCLMLPREYQQSEPKTKVKIQKGTSTLTPFAQLVAEKAVTAVKKFKASLQGSVVGTPGSQVIREIMDASPHTLPSISFFCNRLLSAISVQQRETEHAEYLDEIFKHRDLSLNQDNVNNSDDEDSESGDIMLPKARQARQLHGKKQKESTPELVIRKPEFEVDLDAVANDDTSWIRAIFE